MTSSAWAESTRPDQQHHDPALGGAPFSTGDGHWWWDGEEWVLRHLDASA